MAKPIDLGDGRKAYISDPELLLGEVECYEWLGSHWTQGSITRGFDAHALACVRAWEGFGEDVTWPALPAPEDMTLECEALKTRYAWLRANVGIRSIKVITKEVLEAMKLPEETEKNSERRSGTATSTEPSHTSSVNSEST